MSTLPLVTALIAGFVHALEADHMAAVTTFVSRRPRPLEALGFGLRWGLGHSVAIFVVGGVLIALDVRLPDTLARGLEFGVGGMLLALGLWLLWSVLHERAHRLAGDAAEAHVHAHAHRGGSVWVGVAHGLAGTAPLVAVLPLAIVRTPLAAGAYLLLFGAGTIVAMGIYAVVAGALFHRAGERVPAVGGALRAGTALFSAGLGVMWMVGAAAGN